MVEVPIRLAGKALAWQSVQMGGVKAIFLVRTLVLARLLSPTDFGLVAIATTAMGFLLNVSNLGMIPALVQGKEADDAHYDAAWTVGVTRAAAVTLLMLATAPLIANLFGEPGAVNIIRILALNPLLEALASIKVASLNRNLTFRPLAMMKMVEALVNAVVAILFAWLMGVWGLVFGMLAGAASVVVVSYILAPHRPRLSFRRDAIQQLMNFGRWIFITSLITMAGGYILRLVISRRLGAEALGLYYLAAQLAFLPAEVASEIVGNVAFPLFSRLQNDIQQATRVFRSIYTSLAALLYPACALIIVLSPSVIDNILGPRWEGTQPVISILALVTMIGIFGEAAIPVLKGFGQPYRITLLELLQSTIIISLVWFLTGRYGLPGAALAWLPAISLSLFLNIGFVSKILDKPFSGLLRPVVALLIITALTAGAAYLVMLLIPGIAGLLAAGLLAVLLAAGLLWISDRRFSLGLAQNLAIVFPQIAARIGILPGENEETLKNPLTAERGSST